MILYYSKITTVRRLKSNTYVTIINTEVTFKEKTGDYKSFAKLRTIKYMGFMALSSACLPARQGFRVSGFPICSYPSRNIQMGLLQIVP
jgi:hypothetical protein